jgi:hypothetical protein
VVIIDFNYQKILVALLEPSSVVLIFILHWNTLGTLTKRAKEKEKEKEERKSESKTKMEDEK